jgi:ABC-2 type transport system permease protein/sodium transport system permease protein
VGGLSEADAVTIIHATSASETHPSNRANPQRRHLSGRLQRLVLKELREILRDRRTIITLVVMPILIYPLLAVVFQRFLLTSITVSENVAYDIGVESKVAQQVLARQLQKGEAILAHRKRAELADNKESTHRSDADKTETEPSPNATLIMYPPDQSVRRHVADSSLHLAAIYRHEPDATDKGLREPAKWELVYRAGSPASEAALHFV